MSTNSQYLNGQFSEAQIEQLRPVENYILNEEKNVNKENMASYAEILKDDDKEDENTNSNTSSEKVKPVFLKCFWFIYETSTILVADQMSRYTEY